MFFISSLVSLYFSDYDKSFVKRSLVKRVKAVGESGNRPSKLLNIKSILLGGFKVLWHLLFSLERNDSEYIVFEHGSNLISRTYFLNRSLDLDGEGLIYFNAGESLKFFFTEYSFLNHFKTFTLISGLILLKAFSSLCSNENLNYNWFIKSITSTAQISLARKKFKYIFFSLFTPQTYFSSLFADKLLVDYYFSFSNTLLLDSNQYTYLPNGVGIVCSELQLEELAAFRGNNWINIKELVRGVNEDALCLDSIEKSEVKFKIGIYSSGFWARNENGVRHPITDLQQGNIEYNNSTYLTFLDRVLLPLIAFSQGCDEFKAVIYLHPYERTLKANYNLPPPYMDLIKNTSIELDWSGDDSVSKLYQCEIGISIVSTIISDRISMGLDAYYISNKDENGSLVHDFFDGQYLGQYQKHLINSNDHLRQIFLKSIT